MGTNSILRSSASSLFGQALPLVVALVTMPLVVAELGYAQFGILSIVWAVLGHFAMFDLGLGRAATHLVATQLGHKEHDRNSTILGTACVAQLILGVLGGIGILALAPWISGTLINVEVTGSAAIDLRAIARACISLIALSVPLVLMEGTLRGGLEAHQRFDLINRVRIPVSTTGLATPWLGALAGLSLPTIVLLLVCLRCFALVAYRHQLSKLPGIDGWRLPVRRAVLGELGAFGIWAGISSAIGPMLAHLERFLIAGLLSVSSLALYALPMEALSRLLIVPRSLASVLFPALGELGPSRRGEAARVYLNSIRHLLLLCLPLAILGAALTPIGLALWAGPEFVENCTTVTRILICVVLLNSLSLVPFSVVQGLGKPKWKARLDLVELPTFAIAAWILIGEYGLVGAAFAKLLVTVIDFLALNRFSMKLTGASLKAITKSALVPALPACLLMLCFLLPWWAYTSGQDTLRDVAFLLVGLGLSYWLALHTGLTPRERRALAALFSRHTNRLSSLKSVRRTKAE